MALTCRRREWGGRGVHYQRGHEGKGDHEYEKMGRGGEELSLPPLQEQGTACEKCWVGVYWKHRNLRRLMAERADKSHIHEVGYESEGSGGVESLAWMRSRVWGGGA